MVLPRFYNKKLKHGLVFLTLIVVLGYSLNKNIIHNDISQLVLESHALKQHHSSKFNPRHSTLQVLKYINNLPNHISASTSTFNERPGIVFHWDDWVDLSAGDKVISKYRHKFPHGQCDAHLRKFADVNGYWMESHTKKVHRGMADLYCLKETPTKIIVTTDENFVEVPVVEKLRVGINNLTHIDLSADNAANSANSDDDVSKQHLIDQIHQFDADSTSSNLRTFQYKHLQKQIDVPAADFVFNPQLEIFNLQEKLNNHDISASEIKYLKFLQYADSIVDSADRFFKYPWIYTDVVSGRSHHLAYPFFKRYIGDRERQSVIHHMVRAWFKFAEANNFASWVNYGSLLGWAYNGVNMPWDTDIDVQLPIVQLDRLAREFNQSLILENPRYGNAKYFLEVSPTYIRQGNGRNFIDARFIDINSGLYIDISALSHSDNTPPASFYADLSTPDQSQSKLSAMAVHCKNWNWHSLEELLPIRHTWFEGASIYIPHNVSRILTRKYGSESFTTKSHFADHNYQRDINMWVPDHICPASPSPSSSFTSSSSNSPASDASGFRFANEQHTQLTLPGACNNQILQDEYSIIAECAQRHSATNLDVDHSTNYDVASLNDLPLFRKDAWDYFNDISSRRVSHDRWFVRDEVL